LKKSRPYEIAATISGLVGAFALVGVYMPLLNPGLTKLETHHELPPFGYYLFATPIPLLLLFASLHFNKKARALSQQSSPQRVPDLPWQVRLKWIVFAIVILVVLYAFLW